jgi:uncharacterized protein YdhG (YjbR/CyaY superfamily)
MAKTKKIVPKKSPAGSKKPASSKLNDEEQVKEYLKQLKHPLKAEIEAVRSIIKNVNKNIGERIKWKAPSYYYKEDLVTFNAWADKLVHLVFHHPAIVKIKSPLLQGDYPTRRMVYFKNMKEVKENKKELERVMKELLKLTDKK